MSEEVTLDAFVSETSDEDREGQESTSGSDEEEPGPNDEGAAGDHEVSPVSPTSVYDPDGVRCAGCSDIVERLFRTGGALRCRDCTAWQSNAEADGA